MINILIGIFVSIIIALVWATFGIALNNFWAGDLLSWGILAFGLIILLGATYGAWRFFWGKFLKSDDLARMIYDRIGSDGLLHFAVCAIITRVAGLFFPCWIAWLPALAIAMAKEWADSRKSLSGWSWKDIACDLAGILIGL